MFTCAYIKKRELSSDFCLVFFFNSFLFNFLSKAIGVSNQRETTVVWDKLTGEPLYNAVVWLDLRTQSTVESLSKSIPVNNNFVKTKTGLPLSTYFSAVKLRWLLDNVRKVQKAVEEDRALFGTIDSWLIWVCLKIMYVWKTFLNCLSFFYGEFQTS